MPISRSFRPLTLAMGLALGLALASPSRAQYVEVTPAGSAVSASTNDGNLPSNTVDNNLATRWSASGDGQWLKLDLGQVRTLGYVTIGFYSGNVRQTRFDLQVSSDNSAWSNVITGGISNGTSTQEQTFDFADTSARWVRYVGHGNTVNLWNSVTEVSTFAVSGPTPTPAPTATPTPQPTPTPAPTATPTPAPTATPTPAPTATPTPAPTATPAPRPTPTPAPTATPTPSGAFRHPGVLMSRPLLDLLKSRVAAGIEPQKSAYAEALASEFGSLTYTPKPWQTVECGPYSNPNLGCGDELRDGRAAIIHAIAWYVSGSSAHAQKAIQIMNAWSTTLTGGHINSNGPLQAAWAAEVWPRAAEIIRYTNAGWAAADVTRFENMLKTQYLPSIINGKCANGNWELSMTEGIMNIGIFTNTKATFDAGVALWRGRVPAYLYLKTDGATPKAPSHCSLPSWYGQTTFVDGLCQETCRDYGHTTGGIAAIVNAAETARLQGVDLYGEQQTRITKALELHALYQNGAPVPSWLCGGSLNLGANDTWEIAYNHYHNRRGVSLPQTLTLINTIRAVGANHHMVWETLTHAETGNVQ